MSSSCRCHVQALNVDDSIAVTGNFIDKGNVLAILRRALAFNQTQTFREILELVKERDYALFKKLQRELHQRGTGAEQITQGRQLLTGTGIGEPPPEQQLEPSRGLQRQALGAITPAQGLGQQGHRAVTSRQRIGAPSHLPPLPPPTPPAAPSSPPPQPASSPSPASAAPFHLG